MNTSDLYIVSLRSETWSATAPHHYAESTDNMGRKTRTIRDQLGRPVKVIENYVDGVATETETDTDRITEYEYDSAGRHVTIIAYNPLGQGNDVEAQKTRYIYGTEATEATPMIYRNDVLAIEVYPDSTDTLSQNGTTKVWSITTDNGDHIAYTYDVMGRRTTRTDQRGVEHTYVYNNAAGVGAGPVTQRRRDESPRRGRWHCKTHSVHLR